MFKCTNKSSKAKKINYILKTNLKHFCSFSAFHSFKSIETTSTGLSEFPEYVVVNLLDDELMGYFDNNINTYVNKQSWMEKLGQQYEERQTNILRGNVHSSKFNLGEAMKRFNQSDGNTNLKLYCIY